MLAFEEAKRIFDKLYSNIDGHFISRKAREKHAVHDKTYTYGEILPETFLVILNKVKPKKGEVFYDLGSGTGKAVIFAVLVEDFSKLVGIEIIKDLCDAANTVLDTYRKETKNHNSREIKFINADFLDYDFSDANVIFAHSTCFSEELMKKLTQKLNQLKKGARVITVTKGIESHLYKLLVKKEYTFNWGIGTVFIYEKI